MRDGVEGFIVRAGDVANLSEKLSEMARNPQLRRKMGAAARCRAEHLSWRSFGEHLVRAYEYMLAAVRDPQAASNYLRSEEPNNMLKIESWKICLYHPGIVSPIMEVDRKAGLRPRCFGFGGAEEGRSE